MAQVRRVIYADTLVLLNTLITFLILLSVRAVVKVHTSEKRLIAAAFAGGFASLSALIPAISPVLSLFISLTTSAIVVIIGFCVKQVRLYVRCYLLFLLMTFTYGGVVFFLAQRFPGVFLYRNGFGYFNLPFWTVLLFTTLVYLVFVLYRKYCRSRDETFRCSIELTFQGTIAKGTALMDSGHNVTDCYTGRPVVIVKEGLCRNLLSENAFRELTAYRTLNVPSSVHSLSVRCIPVRTVAGFALLPAFTCDETTIRHEDAFYRFEHLTLACSDQLPDQFDCDAIISGTMLENGGL